MKRLKFGLAILCVPLAILGLTYLTNEKCRVFVENHPGWTLATIAFFVAVVAFITVIAFSDWSFEPSPEDRPKKDCRLFSGGDTGHDCCGGHGDDCHHGGI